MSTRISTSDVLRQCALRVDSVVLLTQFRFIWPHRKNVAARLFLRCTPPLLKVSITSLAREHCENQGPAAKNSLNIITAHNISLVDSRSCIDFLL